MHWNGKCHAGMPFTAKHGSTDRKALWRRRITLQSKAGLVWGQRTAASVAYLWCCGPPHRSVGTAPVAPGRVGPAASLLHGEMQGIEVVKGEPEQRYGYQRIERWAFMGGEAGSLIQ